MHIRLVFFYLFFSFSIIFHQSYKSFACVRYDYVEHEGDDAKWIQNESVTITAFY